jgi:hypothetical protein
MFGLTEEGCLHQGRDYEVGRAFYRNNARGQIIGDTGGEIKLLFSPDDHKILGVHIVGENASELVHVGLVAHQLNGTIETFIDMVFNFPTLGDAYKYAAYDGLERLARRQRNTTEAVNGKGKASHEATIHATANVTTTPGGNAVPQNSEGELAPDAVSEEGMAALSTTTKNAAPGAPALS